MKRIILFLATNLAVVFVLSITLRLLGVESVLNAQRTGLDFNSLLIFAAVIGFGGSLISLFISKWTAKRMTGARAPNSSEQWIVGLVENQARKAGIGMPEVAVFDSPDPNAFATGWNKNQSLVAVSTGLLQHMNKDEVEAVLGHEISHVANGDMVTLALIQGVVNTFVIFLSRVIGFAVDRALSRNDEEQVQGPGFWIASIVAEVILGILASMIVAWFSRQREYRADAGGAHLAGNQKMIAALQKLQTYSGEAHLPNQMAAFGITGTTLAGLFRSHPPLEQRIAALQRFAQ